MNCWYHLEKSLVLASKSPRRAQILAMAGVPFRVELSAVEEVPMEGKPEDIVVHWARMKALDVASRFPDHPVLGADTMVFSNGALLGKPENRDQAFSMLRSLSGKWHTVYGGVCFIWKSRGVSFALCEPTRVKFFSLEDSEIEAYIDSEEPMDKAGAYGIQGLGCYLVERIEGCYFNVMGLPLSHFMHRLRKSLS